MGDGTKVELAYKVLDSRSAEYWRRAKVLIIDEISMVSAELFDKLDYVARVVRGLNRPFGGVQLVVCGDFFQLPPVIKKNAEEELVAIGEKEEKGVAGTPSKKSKGGSASDQEKPSGGDSASVFCFESKAWKEAIELNFELTEVFRQQEDQEFIDMLRELRLGVCSVETERRLLKCQNTVFVPSKKSKQQLSGSPPSSGDGEADGIEPTRMYSTNRNVDETNEKMLDQLEGKGKKYKARVNQKPPLVPPLSSP